MKNAMQILKEAKEAIESQNKNRILVDVVQGTTNKRVSKWAFTCNKCPGNHGISNTRREAQTKSMIHYEEHKREHKKEAV